MHSSRNILATEDNPDSAFLLEFVLSEYRVRTVDTASKALSLAKTSWFDLYILDVGLPDWSGLELCRAIRGFDRNTPIIISSAGGSSLEASALGVGAQRFLPKPVEPSELEGTVSCLLADVTIRAAQARLEECRVLIEQTREDLQRVSIMAQRAMEHQKSAQELMTRAKYKMARWKAYCAFESSGGTRAQFRRLWPGVKNSSL